MDTTLFEDIRPYCDQEVPAVIERLLSSAEYRYVFGKMMPDVKPQEFEQMMLRFAAQVHDLLPCGKL